MDKSHSGSASKEVVLRRANRIDTTTSICKPVFCFPELESAFSPVVVLSPFGAKFAHKKSAKFRTLKGYEIPGILKLGPFELTITARMVSTSPDYAVVEFLNESEALTNILSEFFSVEMVASKLLPFQNFVSTPKAGSSCSTLFSDDEGHQLEIVTLDRNLMGVRGEIKELDVRFSWTASSPRKLGMTSLDGKSTIGSQYKEAVLNFVKNVPGIQKDLHRITVQVLSQALI